MGRLVINGDEIYELDEECMKEKYEKRIKERREYQSKENGRYSGKMPKNENRAIRH